MSKVKLGDVMTLHRGYDLPNAQRIDGDVPIIGSSGVSGSHNVARLHDKNVITGRYGTIGKVFYHDGPCWPLNTTLYVEDFHGNNARYVAYLLEAILASPVINGGDKSTVPGIDRNALHAMEIPYIENHDEQGLIANVLSSIDDKIALNKKIMTELEKTSRLIYDYWFTQFDFPDENGKPYRSSGGKMVYNGTLKREIPQGWEVTTVGEQCELRLGGTPDTSVQEFWGGDMSWLSSAEVATSPILGAEKSITKAGVEGSATSFAPAGSVLLSITRYIRPSILAIDACFNQSVVAILESQALHTEFLYPFMQSQVPRYLTLRTGAQQPHINKETVSETCFSIPTELILARYYDKVAPVFNQLILAAKAVDQLSSLRDWLLPMLMNGQVHVDT